MHDIRRQTAVERVLHFFLTKIIVATGCMVALIAFVEWLRGFLFDKTSLSNDAKAIVVAIVEALVAISGYIFIFRVYDKRRIEELSAATLAKNAFVGLVTGILLQSLFILVIYVAGTYSIVDINPPSTLIASFSFALTAGFVAEIIIIGIVFRLVEEQLGTILALLIFVVLFAVLHLNSKGSTLMSVGATAMQAGFMLPAAFIASRSLWLPIFLHVGWDFAEPGIFGGINPSTSLTQGLFANRIAGAPLITGGQTGPQDSLQALILCLLTGAIFLLLARQKNKLMKSNWHRATSPLRQ